MMGEIYEKFGYGDPDYYRYEKWTCISIPFPSLISSMNFENTMAERRWWVIENIEGVVHVCYLFEERNVIYKFDRESDALLFAIRFGGAKDERT